MVDLGTRCAVFATSDAIPVPSIFKLADLDDFRAVVDKHEYQRRGAWAYLAAWDV